MYLKIRELLYVLITTTMIIKLISYCQYKKKIIKNSKLMHINTFREDSFHLYAFLIAYVETFASTSSNGPNQITNAIFLQIYESVL